ncbi:hypothetical protein [Pelagibius sp. Alg239-R121]|uniref:hypothetical protein n=1 Tax=Pelagibius sp. Alg239-R121 TaxID=2993448 RepID=UPI0024A70F1C|nr:hypothetical protein [Pelagibius sp. Alg239-R121]
MSGSSVSPPVARLIDFLGDLGPRWGLPEVPCRVHGYLYLMARPLGEEELCEDLNLDEAALREALDWLSDYQLVTSYLLEKDAPKRWQTDSDPWNLVLKALEERRRREIGPAVELLRDCQHEAASEGPESQATSLQIGKLLSLAEDVEAIDVQARRLSRDSLRQVLRVGGRAARLFDRSFGKRA